MKLLCVNNKHIPGTRSMPEALSAIEEGKEYDGELDEATSISGDKVMAYKISGTKYKYSIKRFVPISDIDETQMERDYSTIKETVEL